MNYHDGDQILPGDFPKELSRFAISLVPHGSIEVAWKYEHVISAIEYFTTKGYAILGGDVLTQKGEDIVYTRDNWYIKEEESDWTHFVEKSQIKAIDYITKYYLRNGDGYYYAFRAVPHNWREIIEHTKKSL